MKEVQLCLAGTTRKEGERPNLGIIMARCLALWHSILCNGCPSLNFAPLLKCGNLNLDSN